MDSASIGGRRKQNRSAQAYLVLESVEFCAVVAGIAIAARLLHVPLWVWIVVPGVKASVSLLVYVAFLRRSFARIPRHDPASLVGRSGRTLSWLDPEGPARIRGEIWTVRSSDEGGIGPDCDVLVTGVQGSTLLVQARHEGSGR